MYLSSHGTSPFHSGEHRYVYFCVRTCLSSRYPSQLHVITILYTCSSVVKSLSPTPIHTCLTHQLCTVHYILAYRLLFLLTSWLDVTCHKDLTIHSSYYWKPYPWSAYHPKLLHRCQTLWSHFYGKGKDRRSKTSNVTPTSKSKGHVAVNVPNYYFLPNGYYVVRTNSGCFE